ncbi:MAG: hypothetical protein WA510_00650 [Acidobacteriaceae bacterium]
MTTDKPLRLTGIKALMITVVLSGMAFGQETTTPAAGSAPPSDKVNAPSGQGIRQPAPSTVANPSAAGSPPATDLILTSAECRLYASYLPAKFTRVDCELGDSVVVTVSNLSQWMANKNDPQKLILVLNGRVMKGLSASGPTTQQPDELRFDLKRMDLVQGDPDSQSNRDAWNALLGRTKGRQTLNVGVALAGNPPYFGTVPLLPAFEVFPRYWPLIVLFFLALLWAFLLLAHNSDIVRDGPSPVGGPKRSWFSLGPGPAGTPEKLSFSLARCQMAWWFFIILAAYIYIWMVTGERDSLTPGALVLMGISAATGFGSFLVDSSKSDQRQALLNERSVLTSRLTILSTDTTAASPPPNVDDLKAEQQQKTARLTDVTTALNNLPSPPGPSQGFFNDILRDETGVSFHRFQMAVWTVVLGFVFVVAVNKSLAMPDFSATLLGLMGISAGTYVGFKIPDPPK